MSSTEQSVRPADPPDHALAAVEAQTAPPVRSVANLRQILSTAMWALIALLAIAPWVLNPYKLHVLNVLVINIMLITALNLVMGYAGQFAKANVAFMGLGAYTMGLLVVRADLSFWLAWPAGALLATVVGTLVALPALRLRGLYLAVLTISFVLIVHWSFIHLRWITGGASGFSVPAPNFGPVPLSSTMAIYYLALVTMLAVMWLVRNLVASGFGRALLCLAEQEVIAPSVGINVFRTKVAVFALSGAIAGLAGGLHAVTLRYVDPQNFWLLQLVIQLCMVALGGVSSLLGSVLGASLITLLLEALRAFKGLWEFAVGALLLCTIIFFPRGLAGLVEDRLPALRERRHVP
jgi:branched-chain amino acid transport system permease protein